MKKLLLFFLPFLLHAALPAQEIEGSSKVTAVTVFRNMARETRTSLVNLPAGNVDVVISGVSTQMLDQSIQVSVKGDAVLLSASVRTNYFTDAEPVDANPKYQKLQDSIKLLNLELRWITEEKSVHAGELQLVGELLKSASTQKEYKPTDLNACIDIYRARTGELKKKLFDLQLKQEEIQARMARHEGQIAEMGPKAKTPVKEIVLSFWSEIPGVDQIKCNYLVNSAGWTPMYDLNVENTSKPVAMTYKASVFQGTGMDWKNVDLSISTSNPGMNNDRPILSPRYVDYVNYTLRPSLDAAVGNIMYSATPSNQEAAVDPYKYEVAVNESDIQVTYTIETKQSIPSDAKQHICKLQNYNVPATYRYHTVPKLEAAAFLLARITDYGQYNLLPGKANVFMEDTYIGQVDLNPQVTGDTLLVSLGRDEKIVVKRTRILEKSDKKVLSGKVEENFAYRITVRNNKGVPIEIEVLDQVPLSRRTNEIEVKLQNKSGADHDEIYGRILWQLKIDPSKSKTLDLVYTVKYPEGKVISEQ